MVVLVSRIPSRMHDCFTMLARMMGEGSSDKSFHTVHPITVSFILEVRKQMRGFFQLLIISIPVTYSGTLSYQPMLSVSREAPGQAVQDQGQIPPGCICRKLTGVCAGLVTVAVARLTDKWGSEHLTYVQEVSYRVKAMSKDYWEDQMRKPCNAALHITY